MRIKSSKDLKKRNYKAIILIDARSTKQYNVELPHIEPDLVIDVHSRSAKAEATSSLVTLLIQTQGFEFSKKTATALFIGITTDTRDMIPTARKEFDELAWRILALKLDFDDRAALLGYKTPRILQTMFSDIFGKYLKIEDTWAVGGACYVSEENKNLLVDPLEILIRDKTTEVAVVFAILEKEEREKKTKSYKAFKLIKVRSEDGKINTDTFVKEILEIDEKENSKENGAGGRLGAGAGQKRLDPKIEKSIISAKKEDDEEKLENIFRQQFDLIINQVRKKYPN